MRANGRFEIAISLIVFSLLIALALLVLAMLSFAMASLMASEWFVSLPFWAKWLIVALFVVWLRSGHAITFLKKAWVRVFNPQLIGEENL